MKRLADELAAQARSLVDRETTALRAPDPARALDDLRTDLIAYARSAEMLALEAEDRAARVLGKMRRMKEERG